MLEAKEGSVLGRGQVNDTQFSSLDSEDYERLKNQDGKPKFRVLLEVSGVDIPQDTLCVDFHMNPQASSEKITIPRKVFKDLGFNFKAGDDNVHWNDTKFKKNGECQLFATLIEIEE